MQKKMLLLTVITVLCVVLAVIMGDSSIRNLQAVNSYSHNVNSISCSGPDISVEDAIPPCHGPAVVWQDLIAFIVFVSASVDLIVAYIYFMSKYPLFKQKNTQ